jgi:glycine cleavage system aminomethyltransferase T
MLFVNGPKVLCWIHMVIARIVQKKAARKVSIEHMISKRGGVCDVCITGMVEINFL